MVLTAPATLPERLAPMRDEAVGYAFGQNALPMNIDKLYDWLWETNWWQERSDFVLFFRLSDLRFSDEDVRCALDLDEEAPVSNEMRLKFARKTISDDIADDLMSVEEVLLTRNDGMTAFACCTIGTAGHDGPCPVWHGVFQSPDAFRNYLISNGYACSDDVGDSELHTLLDQWDRS